MNKIGLPEQALLLQNLLREGGMDKETTQSSAHSSILCAGISQIVTLDSLMRKGLAEENPSPHVVAVWQRKEYRRRVVCGL